MSIHWIQEKIRKKNELKKPFIFEWKFLEIRNFLDVNANENIVNIVQIVRKSKLKSK